MGVSSNNHGKKTDKETQSPMLKIFKEIMQREHNDLEKATLVREKRKKKRKVHSSQLSKSETKSGESSGVERIKRNAQFNVAERNRAYSGTTRSHTHPFPSEKKDSWWLWGETCSKHNNAKESTTCSCVSCQPWLCWRKKKGRNIEKKEEAKKTGVEGKKREVEVERAEGAPQKRDANAKDAKSPEPELKKIVSNEYACIGCLVFLFVISVIVAFMLVFKTISLPETTDTLMENAPDRPTLDSNNMADRLNRLQGKTPEYRRLDFGRDIRRSLWDNSLQKNSDMGLYEPDFGEQSLQEMENSLVQQTAEHQSSDLSNILDPNKLNDAHTSQRLKNFYKKLIETDAQIKNLKKGLYDNPTVTIVGNKDSLYRLKRSLFHHHKSTKPDKDKTTKATTKTKEKTHATKESKKKTDETVKEEKGTTAKLVEKAVEKEEKEAEKEAGKDEEKKKEDKHKKHKDHKILDGVFEIKNSEKSRSRRFDNGTEPAGVVFEKKQIFVHYLDNKPTFPKCSHAPKVENSHDQLKHPFYKNSQRLDELLDQFLDKNLHDLVNDQFGLDTIFDKKKIKGKEKNKKQKGQRTQKIQTTSTKPSTTTTTTIKTTTMPTTPITTVLNAMSLATYQAATERLYEKYLRPNMAKARKIKTELKKFLRQEANAMTKKDFGFKNMYVNDLGQLQYTPSYDIVLSVSTLMNPGKLGSTSNLIERATGFASDNLLAKLPGRKLMQNEGEDEEAVAYEDFKEVLSDDMSNHDENDRQKDRKRRSETKLDDTPEPPIKLNPPSPGVYNPNWKGPVPLYPDELNSMMKHMSTDKKQHKDTTTYSKNAEDVEFEYLDEYNNDNDQVVKMAQAYSDYGVLDGKKDALKVPIKNQDKDRRVKFSPTSHAHEGISFQFKPYGNKPCDDDPADFFREISKHIAFKRPKYVKTPRLMQNIAQTTLVPMNPDFEIVFNPSQHMFMKEKKKYNNKNKESDYDIPFGTGRSLKSIEIGGPHVVKITETTSANVKQPTPTPANKINNGNNAIQSVTFMNDSFITIDLKPNIIMKREANSNATEDIIDLDNLQPKPYGNEAAETKNISATGFKTVDDVKTAIDELKKSVIQEKIDTLTNQTDKEMGPGEFFALLSNWFSTLAGASEDSSVGNKTKMDPKTITLAVLNKSSLTDNITKDIVYPMYDSDMIDNIGHRSRVLLSIEEEHTNVSDASEGDSSSPKSTEIFRNTRTSIATTNFTLVLNLTKREANTLTDKQEGDSMRENKTIVKRSALDEPNLVFWNDIYDDEYGIKLDPLDENMGKNSAGSELVKKSAIWIQDKMRKMSDSLKRSKDGINNFYKMNKRQFRNADKFKDNIQNVLHKITKRESPADIRQKQQRQANLDTKRSFASLTAHMQEVCRQASHAVQQTRNIRQNENHESEVATGLMQQLVKLMSELVDFEVQQKTCLRLPGDLKDFLEWLTMPITPPPEKIKNQNVKIVPPDEDHIDSSTAPSSEREEARTDARSECLGTLHAVQNLMQEYTQLSDEDKIKMGGVKEYLEDQLDFLHRHLSGINEINVNGEPNMALANLYARNALPYRVRRDTSDLKNPITGRLHIHRHVNAPRSHRDKRKMRKFIRNYGRKHTRTTPNNFESLQVTTDIFKKEHDFVSLTYASNMERGHDTKQEQLAETEQNPGNYNKLKRNVDARDDDKEKRNLQDVYYKALADAKKMSTAKGLRKHEFDEFDKVTVVTARHE